MKKYLFSLCTMLVLSSLLVAGAGAYIKYEILAPMGLYQDKSVMELPFLMVTDNALIYMVRQHSAPAQTEPTREPTVPTESQTTEPSQTPSGNPTETPTEPTEPTQVVQQLDESWFDDALFIGNSLGVGLRDYGGLGNADHFAVIGMNCFNARDTWAYVEGVGHTNLERLLTTRTYGKIYIHLGTNECGYPVDSVVGAFRELVDYIRQNQPDSVIILQGTITFGRNKVRDYVYMTPQTIQVLNEQLKLLAEEEEIYFVDFNPEIADEEGYLPFDFSNDGCHPTLEGYQQWGQWILDISGTLGISANGD